MKNLVFNPYLPLDEYIPDGEPHVFGDRLYIYGSHDRSHGKRFCMNDYVCWSAPCDDLSDWRCEGVIYRKADDPNRPENQGMYAPDVAQGPDGRYYLYYGFGSKNPPEEWTLSVAVCDTPAGKYKYYGELALGKWGHDHFPFDPGIFVDDDGRVWLYYGFGSGEWRKGNKSRGGAVVELAQDMITLLSDPVPTIANNYTNTDPGFDGHAFFEAASMRKIDGKYYLIYSSELSHELCYAVSDRPNGKFVYGGPLISNCDWGYNGEFVKKNWSSNNHGSLVEVNGQWYIFYHRPTQCTMFSRQGCAEKITKNPDGSFDMVECTSCGLNDGPLPAKGTFPAAIAANLHNGEITGNCTGCLEKNGTYYDEYRGVSYIRNFNRTAQAVYKHFRFDGAAELKLSVRGRANGTLYVSANGAETVIPLSVRGREWQSVTAAIDAQGVGTLELRYDGDGAFDLRDITFA